MWEVNYLVSAKCGGFPNIGIMRLKQDYDQKQIEGNG